MTWNREQIRSARQAHLKPILENLGYRLKTLNNGNYEICGLSKTVIIKDNYWVCTDDQSAACAEHCRSGNVIDFCMKILGMSFRQTMKIITEEKSYDVTGRAAAKSYDVAGTTIRSHRENTGDFIQK